MPDAVFRVDLNESFPRLARPPIVEAVIHWQARAQKVVDADQLRPLLAERLPNYPQIVPIQQFDLLARLESADADPIVEHHHSGKVGLRLTSADGRDIIQFTRDGLVFSRTHSYDHWEPFTATAKTAWQVFEEIAAPIETQRLGVRFINHISGAVPEILHEYLCHPPTCPSGLPLKEFVYQSTFAVPGYPFDIRVIKLMQPSMPEVQQSSGLFLDIDVFSTKAIPNDTAAVDESLATMRWLKNKVFFTLLTEGTIQSFQ